MTHMQTVRDRIDAAVNQNGALTSDGLLERLFGRLFQGLVYAQIWEDPVADMDALGLGPGDRVVCIASGGCNMMSYLTADPASITAVDLSPAHVALNRMKLAAARHLPDHAAFYDMFGHADRPENIARFDRFVAPHLDATTRAWWTDPSITGRRVRLLGKGFYRHGLLGRFIGTTHGICRVFGVDFTPLLEARTLDDQRAFFDTRIAPLFETRAVRFLARQRAALFGLGIPPAQYDKLAADGGGDIIAVLRDRTRKLFCDFPMSDNYFAWQAANRGYAPAGDGPVPPYLQARHFDKVRTNAARVSVLNRSVTDVLAEAPGASQDVCILLDAQDWMTDAQLTALWSEITRTAAPGARVLFRTGGTRDILPGRVPNAILSRWRYDADASAKATANDRSAIYGAVHLYRFEG
ncbi:S-adenosylmethionine:diacylglycerol 3-amino-3-carboxypropyl transferase [Marinibacterium anthonyi]|nr:S-adenosylmethionine:diacylglycerol 3-amino-3-carboxypropyl transferase [Marinibacterium anthonyi]